jgi:hypothetical protein
MGRWASARCSTCCAEFDLAMALCGYRTVAEIGRDLIAD